MMSCMLLGFGRFGREHLLAWEQCPEARVAAIVEPASPQTTVMSPRDGRSIPVFPTVAEAVAFQRPDVAAIVTPSGTHHEVATSLIADGIHCLVEKPLATTADLAREVRASLGHRRVVCMPGHVLRFSSPHVELRQRVLDADRRPAHLSFRRDRSAALLRMYVGEHPALLTGVHDIDLAYWVTASPVVEVSARAMHAEGSVIGFDAECRHDSGAKSHIRGHYTLDTSMPDAVRDEIRVIADDDTLLADWTLHSDQPDGSNDALRAEVAHFVDVVSGKEDHQTVTVDDAVHVIDVAEAIVRSAAQSGRTLPVPRLPHTTE